jgi:hypothetical protein
MRCVKIFKYKKINVGYSNKIYVIYNHPLGEKAESLYRTLNQIRRYFKMLCKEISYGSCGVRDKIKE